MEKQHLNTTQLKEKFYKQIEIEIESFVKSNQGNVLTEDFATILIQIIKQFFKEICD